MSRVPHQPTVPGANEAVVVLRNAEDQYALWPAHLAVPAGWYVAAPAASRADARAYVEGRWTDMRPLSLRHSRQPPE